MRQSARATQWVLALTGDVGTVASTLVSLLLFVFVAVIVAVLVLRRRPGDDATTDHHRTSTALPYLAVASCIVLFTQFEGEVGIRGLILLGVGLVLGAVVSARRGPGETQPRWREEAKAASRSGVRAALRRPAHPRVRRATSPRQASARSASSAGAPRT